MLDVIKLPLGRLQTNCYIVGCDETKNAAIIDPSDKGLTIARAVEKAGWSVTHLLLTHTHFDHVGALKTLHELWPSVPVCCHPDALDMLAHAEAAGERWKVAILQPDPADTMLQAGDMIHVGNIKLTVLFTPGHAPGHVTFYAAQHKAAFVGDVLFRESVGRTDFPGCSHELLMQSITTQLLPLPNDTTIYPGHGMITTIAHERANNPFLI